MRYTTPTRSEWEGWGKPTAVIVAMGIVLAAAGIAQTLSMPTSQPVVAFELFVSLLVPTGLATGGIWLARQNVSADVRWQTAIRVSIGIVVACAFGAWLVGYVTLEGGTIHDPLSLTTTLAAVGGATGFVTAVRDSTDVSAPDSTVSGEAARSDDSEPSAASAPSEPTDQSLVTVGTGSMMERPTAAAAVATVTGAETTTDVEVTPDVATTRSDTASPEIATTSSDAASPDALPSAHTTTDTTARTATAVWQNADPRGRTAAPAQPADPVPDDEFDGFDDSRESSSWDSTGRNAIDSLAREHEYGIDAVAAVPSTAETVLEVFQTERTRIALAVLYHEWDDEPRSVDHLARAVSYHMDDSADAVAIGLRHSTLPRLEAIRAVDWDPYADRVSASEHAVFEEGVREASVLLESFEPGTR